MNIEFLGYCTDDKFIKASTTDKTEPMTLESFYNAVNGSTGSGCSCCGQETKLYAVHNCVPINTVDAISLCLECTRRLPSDLEVINLFSCGAPAAIRVKAIKKEMT